MKTIQYLCFIICCVLSHLGFAQPTAPWPTRTVKIVSGLGPGSSMDLVARTIAPTLSEIWGQPVIVENKTGAAGNVAAGYVAGVEDDHTILIAQNAITISASFYPKLSYNLKKDLKPVSQITSMPLVVVVNNNLPVKNLKELIEYAKQRPNELNFSSAGIGNADHMAGELLNAQAGITMTHVPFTSGALALNAVMAGDVQMYLPGLPVSVPNIKAGKVKALAVTTSKRAPVLSELPTVAEAAIPGFSVPLWYGIFANQTMSDASMKKLASDLNKAIKTPDIQNKIGSSGIDLVGSTPEAFKVFVNNEMDLWAQTIKARNLKPD
ncbi:tripartite tricarboxylate transporter substrate binding protein [Polynucleobacter sp. Latsch14-2]|jgi:tripartite-type tricarboxylate transporter receptor subunit TctC|uniref:Bug family tripartite tricarboxylate transporter substrate binding protein n=1 Tax=Polynucleobacter sp. Latsch14-2 TaxID=2576920 RepID=UPI001C0B8651|nr:tripartite tricarboxylate transporter substrate-binding protein [Polynucleobacter sp. Latsch14-2]MBU3614201.1 tripartite tricarboxylate transporter substrate binding protein [Polynucleobacter sp. Latsch14-2]